MKFEEINKVFSNTVRSYLEQGFVISTRTMNSLGWHQLGKVDLTDGNQVIRVYLSEEYGDCDDFDWYCHVHRIMLSVLRWDFSAHGKSPYDRQMFSLWESDAETISERSWYEMESRTYDGEAKPEWFVDSYDEFKAAKLKHHDRVESRRRRPSDSVREYPDSVKLGLLPLVRRFPRCKTAHLEDIGKVWKTYQNGTTYYFVVRGNTHKIVI